MQGAALAAPCISFLGRVLCVSRFQEEQFMSWRLVRIAVALAGFAAVTGLPADQAHGTSNRAYKPNEYLVIRDGLAPSKKFSVRAHGNGELGDEDFHLYLMAEPGAKKIGPLEEVDDTLDTAPDSYNAKWSADSRHVGLFYRSERHVVSMRLYRVENRRAYIVNAPTLLTNVAGRDLESSEHVDIRSKVSEIAWRSPTRFVLKEWWLLKGSVSDLQQMLGKYAKPDDTADNKPGEPGIIKFAAEALCELTADDTWRVIELKPGRYQE